MEKTTIILNDGHLEFLSKNKIHLTSALDVSEVRKRLLGKKLAVGPETLLEPHCLFASFGGVLHGMGAHSYSNSRLLQNISVGRFSSIAYDVITMPETHPLDRLTTSSITYTENIIFDDILRENGVSVERKPIEVTKDNPVIGNDVWIGFGTTIAQGVTIGDGAVIAARSIVTKDVPPFALVAGSPAVVKRMRFKEPLVERLLKAQWWRYHLADFADLDIQDPERFLDGFEERLSRNALRLYEPAKIHLLDELLKVEWDAPVTGQAASHVKHPPAPRGLTGWLQRRFGR